MEINKNLKKVECYTKIKLRTEQTKNNTRTTINYIDETRNRTLRIMLVYLNLDYKHSNITKHKIGNINKSLKKTKA